MLKPLNISNLQIEEFVNEIRTKLSFNKKPFLTTVVENLGGTIAYCDHPNDSLIIKGKNDFTVFVSKYLDPPRVKFSLAHDLGHYFLHYINRTDKSDDIVIVKYNECHEMEREASAFAMLLLMPEEEFLKVFEKYDKNLDLVSNYFGVTEVVVDSRLLLYEMKQRKLNNE